ncbi:unnamed protein product [Caenorhabditis nigoni]
MMKEKIYASGWPKNVKTEEEKEAFVARYKEKEAITLDPALFEANAGKIAVSKLSWLVLKTFVIPTLIPSSSQLPKGSIGV